MSTENWLMIITGIAGVATSVGVAVLKVAVGISSTVARIEGEMEAFSTHREKCDADRQDIWKELTELKLQQAAH